MLSWTPPFASPPPPHYLEHYHPSLLVALGYTPVFNLPPWAQTAATVHSVFSVLSQDLLGILLFSAQRGQELELGDRSQQLTQRIVCQPTIPSRDCQGPGKHHSAELFHLSLYILIWNVIISLSVMIVASPVGDPPSKAYCEHFTHINLSLTTNLWGLLPISAQLYIS